jgi:hypothetical protein
MPPLLGVVVNLTQTHDTSFLDSLVISSDVSLKR